MNKIISNSKAILDNIFEGYPVKATRTDGQEYIISMERVNGDEFFKYQVEGFVYVFNSFDDMIKKLSNHDFLSIEF